MLYPGYHLLMTPFKGRNLCIVLFVWTTISFAQGPDTLWTKTYGGDYVDRCFDIKETSDSGYIAVGETDTLGNGNMSVWLLKLDSNGDTLWTKTYGDDHMNWGESIQQTSDGGYIIAGSRRVVVHGMDDVYLVKTNSNGDTLWTRIYGGDSLDNAHSVQQTFDGGYVVVGWTGWYYGNGDIWLLKLDNNGDTLWTKTYGGAGFDRGCEVQQTPDSGYIIVGYTDSYGAGSRDIWLLRTDAYGDTIWTKIYGGEKSDFGFSVDQTNDGGFVVAGYTESFGTHWGEVWLLKTDASGDTLWTKTIGEDSLDRAYEVKQTTDGGYFMTGITDSYGSGDFDIYAIKTNSNGDTLWATHYGGSRDEYTFSGMQSSDGGYVIAGWTYSFGQEPQIYLVKLGPDIGVREEGDFLVNNFKTPGLVYGDLLKLSGLNEHTCVKIFDVLGREVLHQEVTPAKSYIRLNNLKSGIYFLSIKEGKPNLNKFVLIR